MEKSKREFLFCCNMVGAKEIYNMQNQFEYYYGMEAEQFTFYRVPKILFKHFMDIMNGSYAQTHFPCKLWDAGEKGLTLSALNGRRIEKR